MQSDTFVEDPRNVADYLARLDDALSRSAVQAGSANRFRLEAAGIWTALPFAGITVLAEPYPLREDRAGLAIVQRALLGHTDFAPVPPETFHMTVADLVSGDDYGRLTGSGAPDSFVDASSTVLSSSTPLVDEQIRATTVGVAIFGRAVVALVSFTPTGYDAIRTLRHNLATDENLRRMGFRRRVPFRGHVTLGYWESPDDVRLNEAVAVARNVDPLHTEFEISAVRLYTFNDLAHYTPVGRSYGLTS